MTDPWTQSLRDHTRRKASTWDAKIQAEWTTYEIPRLDPGKFPAVDRLNERAVGEFNRYADLIWPGDHSAATAEGFLGVVNALSADLMQHDDEHPDVRSLHSLLAEHATKLRDVMAR